MSEGTSGALDQKERLFGSRGEPAFPDRRIACMPLLRQKRHRLAPHRASAPYQKRRSGYDVEFVAGFNSSAAPLENAAAVDFHGEAKLRRHRGRSRSSRNDRTSARQVVRQCEVLPGVKL